MRFTRRRSDRPDPARRRLGSSLEILESRELLSTSSVHPFYQYLPTDLPVSNPITHKPIPFSVDRLIQKDNPQSPLLSNEGKIVTGKDRAGNEWTITVHGPGVVEVTDATPNDGSLDDDINTIQLYGTDINKTYVTGSVVSSARSLVKPTDGTVVFNRLIDTSPVNSIILNGFNLTQTVAPPIGQFNNSGTGIFLTGGARHLEFNNITATIDQATSDRPINVIIGDPSTPLTVKPTIKFGSIFNTVYDSSASLIPTLPQTRPTVNFLINGQLHAIDFVSSTQAVVSPFATSFQFTPEGSQATSGSLGVVSPDAFQYAFPITATTGQTAIRAFGVDTVNVRGSAVNVTASRGPVPFQNGFSGLDHLNSATFGGNADAVGLDVNGRIGKLDFKRGLGNPLGTSAAATSFGIPAGTTGFPAAGLLGGLVTANRIGQIKAGPADTIALTAQNPDFVQLRRQGSTTYYPRPGTALTHVAIVSSGSIGGVHITGNTQASEIKSGFHYPSFVAGLEGTRATSVIGPAKVKGDLVDGVVSASQRPFRHGYSSAFNTKGESLIVGHLSGRLYQGGEVTPLGNKGAGFFARHKVGYLPPPQAPTRRNGVLLP